MKTIMIGGVPWTLYYKSEDWIQVTRADAGANAGDHGMTDTDDRWIAINPMYSPWIKAETLLHELMHAAFSTSGGIDVPRDDSELGLEEHVVRRLSTGLYSALLDEDVAKLIMHPATAWDELEAAPEQ